MRAKRHFISVCLKVANKRKRIQKYREQLQLTQNKGLKRVAIDAMRNLVEWSTRI